MVIRTYTRKLNRTLLKKTGTKNAYITDKKLLEFFGFDNISQLITRQNDLNKIVFHLKNTQNQKEQFLFKQNETIDMHIVRGVNTEIRLSGNDFSYLLETHGFTETDSIIIEKILSEKNETKYFMSFSIGENTIAVQPYDNNKELYWTWDNSYNIQYWEDVPEFNACIYDEGIQQNKKLRFRYVSDVEIEMVARNEVQQKKLFAIEEYSNGSWTNAIIYSPRKTMEIIRAGNDLEIYNRDKMSSKIIDCEV